MVAPLSRRRLLQAIASTALAGRAGFAAAAPASLGAIAARHGLMFGAAAAKEIFGDAAYRELYVSQAKVVTTDLALKIGTVAPQPGAMHFEQADRLLAFCDANRIAMRGHCLIWNDWVPAWIKAMTQGERQKYFDSYIDDVVGRYVGRLQSWDIVNEPFWPGNRLPGGFRMGPWYDAFGPDYVRRAFERASRVDRNTIFVLNEAQTERDDELGLAVRKGLLALVADLKHAGVKLDVVGLQGHLQPQYPHDAARYEEFLHALADLGVDIYITEFDVRDDIFPDDVMARDRAVADLAGRYLRTTLRQPFVKALVCWELADKYSFYRSLWQHNHPGSARLPRPLPYDEQLQPKPLWHAIAQNLESVQRPGAATTGNR